MEKECMGFSVGVVASDKETGAAAMALVDVVTLVDAEDVVAVEDAMVGFDDSIPHIIPVRLGSLRMFLVNSNK
ncbi:hypothetical protein DSO57_1039548 [Entomophthora muscae]|uniref:Uncharacterized protein n=1 Tax=Entomophthora muscae TaxID=34485 RepID=A0ACC2TKC0_9FUNG|nr:hypothetical protein DSO57_1039548 [Entomophthora muscae]